MILIKDKKKNSRSGFTLLEILLVVAAISILAGIVIFAINPGKQLADTRNAQRRVDVNTILNAVYQYLINNGTFPAGIIADDLEICRTGESCIGLADLSVLTADEKYLVSIPLDPTGSSVNGSGYAIKLTSYGRVTVQAPYAENGLTISVTN